MERFQDQLGSISAECCTMLRKGPEAVTRMVGPVEVTDVYLMPHVNDAPAGEQVDVHFMVVAVDEAKAASNREAFINALKRWPEPERLAGGPSYIEVGAVLGSQDLALCMFALGQVLGLWRVITPKSLGATDAQADDMAGRGFVMCTGWKP